MYISKSSIFCDAIQPGISSPTFRRNVLPYHQSWMVRHGRYQEEAGDGKLDLLFNPAKTEAVLSSETSVNFQTIQSHTPEYSTLHNHRYENIKVCWRFGGTCLLPAWRWFLAWLIIWLWRWRRHISPKRRLSFNGIHSVISKKIEVYKLFVN
jgi:hypothetical protein